MMKKLCALTLALMMMVGCVSAMAADVDMSVEAILEKGTLVMGLDDGFPPMGFRDENNDIVGYDVDLARAVCERLGVELTLQPIDWSAKEMELATGTIDCIWNGMSITEERLKIMTLTFPYLNNEIILYALKDSGIASIGDMAGKSVAVQSGSFAEKVLDEMASGAELKGLISEALRYEEYLTALMDMQAGGVDAVLIDKVVAEFRINAMGDDAIVPVVSLEDDNFGVGFRKEDVALRDKVENILKELAADGTIAEISTKWFGEDISTIQAD